MHFAIRSFVFGLLLTVHPTPLRSDTLPDDTNSRWNSAVEALNATDWPRGRDLLKGWIASQAQAGVHSAEAHYNLALACWNLKDAGCASYHLLESALLSSSPLAIWNAAEKATAIENQMGMKEGISDSVPFRTFLLLNKSAIAVFATMGIWCLLAAMQGLTTRRRAFLGIPSLALIAIAFILLGTSAGGWLNRRYLSDYGVLAGKPDGVPLLRMPSDTDDKKLADLPNGTVVRIAEYQERSMRITAPVSGWIAAERVRGL